MTQMPLAEYDQMIKTLASDRADQSFGIAVLPRRSRRRRSVANAHRSNSAGKCFSVDSVAIANEVSRRLIPANRLSNLPRNPFGRGMRGDPEPENASSVVA